MSLAATVLSLVRDLWIVKTVEEVKPRVEKRLTEQAGGTTVTGNGIGVAPRGVEWSDGSPVLWWMSRHRGLAGDTGALWPAYCSGVAACSSLMIQAWHFPALISLDSTSAKHSCWSPSRLMITKDSQRIKGVTVLATSVLNSTVKGGCCRGRHRSVAS